MAFFQPIGGSLARRFAISAATLATTALLLITLSSWWMVRQQHETAERILQQKEAEFHAVTSSRMLRSVTFRLAEMADSSILATGLVDSAGRETYLGPYLNSMRQVSGIPVQILFADFEGKEISSNGGPRFTAQQLEWFKRQLADGKETSAIFNGAKGPEIVAVELMAYSRTQTPEGALLYKIALADLQPAPTARLSWKSQPLPAAPREEGALEMAVDVPANFQHLGLHLVAQPVGASSASLTPQYGVILVLAFLLAAGVFIIGSRMAVALTRDLRHLEAFSRTVVKQGFGVQRAAIEGSTEVAGLAGSINTMLDRLYEQHTLLQHETDKLHQLANTIPQLAWIAAADGSIHWYNQRWYAYTGTTPDAMEESLWQRMPPDIAQRMQAAIAAGEPFQMTIPLRGADGEQRPFFTSAAPLRDATGRVIQWFGTNTDVSPLERAERAVRDSEERLREGLIAARMAVWDWDLLSGNIHYSANSREVFGRRLEDEEGAWNGVHPDDLPQLRDAISAAIAQCGTYEKVVRMMRDDGGEPAWIDIRGKVICNDRNTPVAIRGISIDITQRKRAEDALRAANRRKDDFLAMLAHELRNPLAPISTAAELLKLTRPDQRVANLSDIITRQVEHMTNLVDDLLDVSRVTRGLIKLDKEPLDVAELLHSAVEQVRPLIESKQHRLSIDIAGHPVRVLGDKTRLVQIVANLLNNAAKYTPEDGDIRLRMIVHDTDVEIGVQDNGIGIAPELLPHVFELFTQAERSPDRSQGGLGLGLALVKSLTELHGGSVTASSQGTGCGSTFLVRIPLLQADEWHRAEAVQRRPEPNTPMHGARLMVVDDNTDAASSLAMLLEAEGFAVSVEHDAVKALERAYAEVPDALLLDIGLPEMDGYELARRLRARPETAHALLIAVSGYGQMQDRIQSKAAGFDHHLVKPVNRVELLALLATREARE